MESLVLLFFHFSLGLKEKKLSENVTVYPTNSASKLSYVMDAFKIWQANNL